jgi:hypothetical protein
VTVLGVALVVLLAGTFGSIQCLEAEQGTSQEPTSQQAR